MSEHADRNDTVVLGLPRGGVVVAFEVARALGAPLDIFLVRSGVYHKAELEGEEELVGQGVFAAGDCTEEPFQMAKAVGEGQVGALQAVRFLRKRTVITSPDMM